MSRATTREFDGSTADRVIKLHAGPALGLGHRRMRRVGIAHGEIAAGIARVVVRVEDAVAENGDARAMRGGGSGGDQHAAAAANVALQIAFERRGKRDDIRENHEGVSRRVDAAQLLDRDRLQRERGFGSGSQRSAEIERRPRIARFVDEQHVLRDRSARRRTGSHHRREARRPNRFSLRSG